MDGHEIFSCTNHRYETTVHPVIDLIDMVIHAIASLFHLRNITLVRTEYEVGREIVGRLPRAERNISEFMAATKNATPALDSSGLQASTPNDSVRYHSRDVSPGCVLYNQVSSPISLPSIREWNREMVCSAVPPFQFFFSGAILDRGHPVIQLSS
ncbi:MAG: hypothetical protein H0X47_08995 [Nitrospirales bacterium]|nr:hypothetical protein [Nitrospirales bacterium]